MKEFSVDSQVFAPGKEAGSGCQLLKGEQLVIDAVTPEGLAYRATADGKFATLSCIQTRPIA